MQSVAEALANLEKTVDSPLFVALGERFTAAGHELALVGGPVRDAFLGRRSPDLDFTTTATPDEILSIIDGLVDAHWDIGREFGTIGARIGDDTVEITTYRADKYDPASRKPEVAFGTDLNEDLFRRDFTINSMALRLPEKTFVDPFNGLQDLIDGVIRTPGAPEVSFGDDPLRMMRGARFASQLGFEIEPATFAAMTEMAERIEIISAERVQTEFVKLMLGAHPRRGLEALVESGLAERVLPELPALKLEVDEHHHHKDVYEHTLRVVEQAISYEADYGLEGDVVLRFAALLHDIGKVLTHEHEGTHVQLGVEVATKYGENPLVVNCIAAHHDDVPHESEVSVLVQAGDSISGSRPGARREAFETYVKRLEGLEKIASSYRGVERVFAIQAGREIRVVVSPTEVTDDRAREIARELRKRIETELQYPSTIRITVIREARFTETAT